LWLRRKAEGVASDGVSGSVDPRCSQEPKV
jgi:hypothetical protein